MRNIENQATKRWLKICSPTPPSPQSVIGAQTQSNRDTAIAQAGLNAVNQTDAAGNTLTYSQNGTWADGTPKFSATQSLSAAGQQLLNTNQGTQQNLANLAKEQSGRLSSLLSQPIDFSGAPALRTNLGTDDFSADRQRVEDALFARLQPQMDRDQQAFETSLINRGIRPGSDAYAAEMQRNQMGINDQRTSILLNAGQEQNRLQQLALNDANFANNARSQSISEMLTQRQLPLNELLALAGQGQVSTPSFTNTPQTGVGGVDAAGITQQGYANQMAGYNNQQGILGGLFSAGASLLPLLSDRRAKRDIDLIGLTAGGNNVYRFRYKDSDDWHVGVMAQEVMQTNPDAVWVAEDNLYRVNYAMVA